MLKIITESGHTLDLFPDTVISIEENSPMFTDIGAYSIPLSLPPTVGNLTALGFPDRFQRADKFVKTQRVSISVGAYHRVASMHIDSAVFNNSISATLYLRESSFYQKIKGQSLRNLFEGYTRTTTYAWYEYCSQVMCGDISDDFHVFPVLLVDGKERTEVVDDSGDGFLKVEATWFEYTIANRPNISNDNTFDRAVDKNQVEYIRLTPSVKLHDAAGNPYFAPDSYGTAPYLKFTYVLRQMFAELGYTLVESVFDTDTSFRKLCIVHPVIDACVGDVLRYSQLLPDVDVDTFMRMAENSFGVRFIVDEVHNTVTPRFWRDVLLEAPVDDVSPLVEDYGEITYAGNKNIKLTATHDTAESQPLVFDTMQQIVKKYGPYRDSYASDIPFLAAVNNMTLAPGVYLIRNTRTLRWVAQSGSKLVSGYVDKYLQDYYPTGSDIPLEERQLGFALTPLMDVPLAGRTVSRANVNLDYMISWAQDVIQKYYDNLYGTDDGLVGRIPYLGQVQHLNTVVETVSTTDGVSSISYTEESDIQPPVYLAFAHGRAQSVLNQPLITKTFFASQDAYSNSGNVVGNFDLMPFSLYENFWRLYDDLLNTSFHDYSAQIHLSPLQVSSLRFDKPLIVHGQPALPYSITYELSDSGVQVVDFTLRTIRKYS